MLKIRWFLGPLMLLVLASPAGAQMTPGQAVAFVRAQHSDAAMSQALDALSPSDRQYVIDNAITPRTVVVTDGAQTTVTAVNGPGVFDRVVSSGAAPTVSATPIAAIARHRVRAHAASCSGHSHDFTAKSYSYLGLWQFTFHSTWQWTGCSGPTRVTAANHQERGDTAIGWGFDNSQYGAAYGKMGTYMIGRETFGHFSFVKYAVHDTADLQVQVHGDGGWWAWANITGP